MLKLVQAQLLQDPDPLSHIEPGAMWNFKADSRAPDRARPGEPLDLKKGVAAKISYPEIGRIS